MRALTLLSTLGLFVLGACAPLQNQTHYERWDAYAAAHPEEAEEEDGPEAPPKDMKKAAPAAKPMPAKKPAPPPPAPADYSSLGGSGTPAISGTTTATKSRVVQPEPEDEPLY